MTLYICLTILGIAFILRLLLLKKASLGKVDGYYWSLYREAAREQNNIPPAIKYYLLDLRQWYLPIYGSLLKFLSDFLFRKDILLTQIISLFRFAALLAGSYFINGMPPTETVILALIVYLLSPALFTYDTQLNARILGALFFDLLVIVILILINGFSWPFLALFCALLVIILFLHQMTMQLVILLLPAFALASGNLYFISALAVSILTAFLMNYRKYFLMEIDITAFWYRNRKYIGSGTHQINNSPCYSNEDPVKTGLKNAIFQLVVIFSMSPFVLFFIPVQDPGNPLFLLALLITAIALATTYIPWIKCWGQGRSYMYYQPGVIVLYLLTSEVDMNNYWNILILVCSIAICLVSMKKYLNWLNGSLSADSRDRNEVLAHIKNSRNDRLLSVPVTTSDEIAFKTRKKVMWGGHGFGFKLLEPVYPVLLKPVEVIIDEWGLGILLIDKKYWPGYEDAIKTDRLDIEFENEQYVVFETRNWVDNNTYPSYAMEAYPGFCPDTDNLPG